MFDYKLGTVVQKTREAFIAVKSQKPPFGHIVGFDQVEYETGFEPILKVLWQDGTTTSIHPTNVTLYAR